MPSLALTSPVWAWLAGGVLAAAIVAEGWDLWSGLSRSAPVVSAPPVAAQPAEAEAPDYAARIGQHRLLGEPVAKAAPVETKRTSLDLRLIGTLAGTEPPVAIIEGPSGQRAYAVGEAITGGVSVKAIEPRRVLLDNRGSLEALEMARPTSLAHPSLDPSARAEDKAGTAVSLARSEAAGLFLAAVQGRGIRAAQVRHDGALKGYRLLSGSAELMTQLGLAPMDILTHVNDQPVAGITGRSDFLAPLLAKEAVVLRVERDGRSRHVRVRLHD